MYSLYRAWFGDENYPQLDPLSPPDTVIRVGIEGEHQFVAHRGILAAHSGHLKALLSSAVESPSSTMNVSTPGITSVSISSIGGEAFAPLLNYMYTGRLEVNSDNIFNVLFATHLLHMPGALEQCRAALLRLEVPPPPPPPLPTPSTSHQGTSVLRPVPNRLIGPPICWPQTGLYSSPTVGFPHLPNLQLPTGFPVLPNSRIHHETSTTAFNFRVNSQGPSLPCYPDKPVKFQKKSASPKSTMSKLKDENEIFLRISDLEKEESLKKDLERSPMSSPPGSSGRISVTNAESPLLRQSGRNSRTSNDNGSTTASGVVLDVACCDGPVKFHRVLNENYITPPANVESGPRSTVVTCTSTEPREVTSENDENGRPPDRKSEHDESSASSASFTCEYCRHTFKSHYCYKKHARRHLLPPNNDTSNVIDESSRVDGRRREVRLLDLNVQYYPCKICGDRFPSYYFVHKHKKLVHAITTERNSEGECSQGSGEVAGCSTKP